MKAEFIRFKRGDTTFNKGLRKYDNGQVQFSYLERFYPTVFKSGFDPDYRDSGAIDETLYREEFFENGKPKYLFGRDTSFAWYGNGQLSSKKYKDGSMKFSEAGGLQQRSFSWLSMGTKRWRNLQNTLYVDYYPSGSIKEIELVRDEPSKEGIYPAVRYSWKWSREMTLVDAPKRWREPFPWTRFAALQLPLKMQKGLERK